MRFCHPIVISYVIILNFHSTALSKPEHKPTRERTGFSTVKIRETEARVDEWSCCSKLQTTKNIRSVEVTRTIVGEKNCCKNA